MLLRGEPLRGSHILPGMCVFRSRGEAESGLVLAAPPIMHNPTELPLDYHAANSPVIGSTRSLSVTTPSGRSVADSTTIANG